MVIFHLWPNRLPGGYHGVDVFFVISGYLVLAASLVAVLIWVPRMLWQQFVRDVWKPAIDAKVPIVALRDNPEGGRTPESDPNICLVKVGAEGVDTCALSRQESVDSLFDPYEEAAKRAGRKRAFHLDMTRWYCDDEVCPTVIGGANVYRDSNHVTITYARTLAPYFRQALTRAGLLD
ncbi:hypothetical protein KV097_00940 [Mumia sp. zg.B17]|uniref:SGNH hydrolase domain-containing protein n=1 Tax=Mumia sp. zg.B17 TaxID=2855446 RepID=UPI001C6DDD00|nr:SGNH hydrolase domain-containing protein [Mumia sp. zg.B17]MBW9204493.1 hypothetical protein [Mumia sp. zg.B17]